MLEGTVVLNVQSSPWGEVSSGVPQGSIFGPLFLLRYIQAACRIQIWKKTCQNSDKLGFITALLRITCLCIYFVFTKKNHLKLIH